MLTSKQKETISILKNAYKKINSETNCVGVFLDIDSIISEHQKGKNAIAELNLHNKAIKSTYRDILEDFKNKAQGDFQQLGWTLDFKKGGSYLHFSSPNASFNLGYFEIESKYSPVEIINNQKYQKIHSAIYRVSFSSGNNSYGSYKGFEELLKREEVKKEMLKTYNRDNR
jgi:hypothetical protein|tara:strand:- start:892 stop:1404 length:513 start_codon:yes stop_codon:yes gene_type:complete